MKCFVQMRKWFIIIFIVIMMSPASAEDTIYRGNDSDPSTLDPHRITTMAASRVLNDLYEGLVTFDARGNLIPGAAISWQISENSLVYTFHLRPNGRWSNGDPVTASDFEFSLKRLLNPNTAAPFASLLYPIKNAAAVAAGKLESVQLGVRALDERTLQINLEYPTPYFLQLLAHPAGFPVHRTSIESSGEGFSVKNNVTNGVYKLISFRPNQIIELRKNEYYWQSDNIKIENVNWIPFENRSACMRRFEAAEVHICSEVAAGQMDYIKANLADEFRSAASVSVYYLNVKGEPGSKLRDPRVREAISLAIDRDFLANEIWHGLMLPAHTIVPPGIANYVKIPIQPKNAINDMLDREDRARQLLSQAGITPGALSLTLRYDSSENYKNTMASIASMLRNIGLNAAIEEFEATSYYNYLQEKGPYDIANVVWTGDYNDPSTFLDLFRTGSYFNFSNWSDEEYDDLLKRSMQITDMSKRAEVLAKAETILIERGNEIPLGFLLSTALVSKRVHGYEDNIMGIHASRWLSMAP